MKETLSDHMSPEFRALMNNLSAYTDLLIAHGEGSPEDRAFLAEHSEDRELMTLARTVRAMRAFYQVEDPFNRD
jgi:hypothetical protein